MIRIANFVGGSFQDSLDGTFRVSSPFFEYVVDVPNSCVLDIGDALSLAKRAQKDCSTLSVEERCRILNNAAEKFNLSDEELEHLVEMQGMPINFVKEHAMYSRELFRHTARAAKLKHGFEFGALGRRVDVHGLELRLPPDGLAVAFIPPNDPAEAAFVMSHAVMSGASLILKPSQQEPYMALKIADLLTKCGYPVGGLSVVHWNTADASRGELTGVLLRDSSHRIVMGDYATARSLLGSVEQNGAKNCVFSAGKSKAIVDVGANLDQVVESIMESSLHWTNNCVSTKSVIVVGEQIDEFMSLLRGKFEASVVGDPFNAETTIGYVDWKMLDQIEKVVKGQQEFSYADFRTSFTRLGKVQMRPLLVYLPRPDVESPFVSHELPYVLAVMQVSTFEEAVRFVNEASVSLPEKRCMAVSVYGREDSLDKFAAGNCEKMKRLAELRAYNVFYNKPSTRLSPYLMHQGTDLTGFLSSSLSISEPDK